MFEKAFEEYKKLPKWKGKIFMKDEETCYKDGAEFGYNKAKEELKAQIADLEKKISVLLSCKNCSENKGGYICHKEYEDKCLAQKKYNTLRNLKKKLKP